VLDIGNHDSWRVKIELLCRVVGAEGKKSGTWAIDGETADKIESWDGIMSDVLCPDIP
jgi:hypothetical protein